MRCKDMNCSLNYQKIIHKYIDFQPYIVTV